MIEEMTGRRIDWTYSETNRIGDHIWYVSDLRRFQADYPGWRQQYDLDGLLRDIYAYNVERWERERA